MSKISVSPERNSFQKESYLKNQAEKCRTPENDNEVKQILEQYDSWNKEDQLRVDDPNWRRNNLEYDLRSTEWILQKARSSNKYAQNLYAALCNNDFQKLEVFPILKEETWGCSWRHAGGIIADMQEKGDYIDWYCSGMGDKTGSPEIDAKWENKGYVNEGHVTDEIRQDLKQLGWIVIPNNDE